MNYLPQVLLVRKSVCVCVKSCSYEIGWVKEGKKEYHLFIKSLPHIWCILFLRNHIPKANFCSSRDIPCDTFLLIKVLPQTFSVMDNEWDTFPHNSYAKNSITRIGQNVSVTSNDNITISSLYKGWKRWLAFTTGENQNAYHKVEEGNTVGYWIHW